MISKISSIIDGSIRISDKGKFITLVSCIAFVHLILISFFLHLNILTMAIYNCISFIGYLICLRLTELVKMTAVYVYICAEVILYALLASYTMGVDYGFTMYLIAIVPVGFDMSFSLKNRTAGIKASVIVGLLGFAAFIVCRIFSYLYYPVYQINDPIYARLVYLFNMTCTFAMLIVYSFLFACEINAAQINLMKKNSELNRLANIDTLTGMYNRRSMHELLKSCSENERFSVIMGDIDFFKKVNDTYGHDCGDEVLKNVAEIIKSCTDEDDYVCRWGGEEVLIATSKTNNDVYNFAEKIRSKIETSEITHGSNNIKVTITFGISEYSKEKTIDSVITEADKKLYEGKSAGRTRVII